MGNPLFYGSSWIKTDAEQDLKKGGICEHEFE